MAVSYNHARVQAANTAFRAAFVKAAPGGIYTPLVLAITSDTLVESYQIPEMLGPLAERKGDLQIEVPVRFSKDVTNVVYEKGVGIPLDDINDDHLGLYKAQIDGLAMSAKGHMDILVANVLTAGFTTAKSYDGVALFSDSHPIDGGAVQSNLQSGALSSTTFGQAEAKLDGMTDYYGSPLRLSRFGGQRYLIVGPSNRATAKSIVEIPTTSSGAGNPYYGSAKVLVEEGFVGSHAGKWVLAQGGGVAPMVLAQTREAPSIVIIDGPQTFEVTHKNRILVKARMRGAAAPLFYQAAVGSLGS